MKQINFNVPIYKWNITVITIYNREDKEVVLKIANENKLPNIEVLESTIEEEAFDGGQTYSKGNSRKIIVFIFPWKSEAAFINTLNHEKRHIVDNILEWHNINDSEAAAYLDGYISEKIFENIDVLK